MVQLDGIEVIDMASDSSAFLSPPFRRPRWKRERCAAAVHSSSHFY